ncbi:hypothetical protein [Nannocystis pusilla]|uniref:hypothetical protein n=1 Tax=Nannocystis pusilla TaxID=889268 RepID=UPI003BF41509
MNPANPPVSSRSSAPALATETFTDTNWSRFLQVSAVGILIPAVILAPVLLWALPFPEMTLWRSFVGLVKIFFFLVPIAVIVHGGRPGVEYLKRTICRIEVFEHGVEVRDGQGALLGETADGSARVSRANLGTNRGMYGAVSLAHRGGKMLLTPPQFLGAYPGLPATHGTWRVVPEATYQLLLRFAA